MGKTNRKNTVSSTVVFKHAICIWQHIEFVTNKLNMRFYKIKIVSLIVSDTHKVNGFHTINIRTVLSIKEIKFVYVKRWFWRRSRHLPTILLKLVPISKMIPDQSSRSIFAPVLSTHVKLCVAFASAIITLRILNLTFTILSGNADGSRQFFTPLFWHLL